MIQKTSAPGKVILFGEHAVVYGMPAIAIPVSSLRAYAILEEYTDAFLIVAEDLKISGVSLTVDMDYENNPLTKIVMLVLDYFQKKAPCIKITLKSDIPIASGLGSGAAVSAALGRAVALAVDEEIMNETLNQLVYEVEKIHHGTPSGIDNTVVVHETPIYFVKSKPIQTLKNVATPFQILVADTGQASLTHESVGDVRRLYESNPNNIQPVLDQIDHIVREALICMTDGNISRLGALMTQNHKQLQKLTVSSPELDQLVNAALASGALGAKLSGGGRGGNMIALVRDDIADRVKDALESAGAVRVFSSVVK